MVGKWAIVFTLLALLPHPGGVQGNLATVTKIFARLQETVFSHRDEVAKFSEHVKFNCRTVRSKKQFLLAPRRRFSVRKLAADYPLAFIIHGWADAPQSEWVQGARESWMAHRPQNVCIVDWSFYAQKDYKVAMLSIFDVGRTIAKVIKLLEANGFSRHNTTLVGFSLGAHVAGYAGRILGGEIGEIIGLDPAGPMFTMPVDVGPKYRLDPTDAKFVQVMHTAGGTLGTHVKCGHADFYPNGGAPPQTNCVFTALTNESKRNPVRCSHSIVVSFFGLSIDPKFELVGYHCRSYRFYLLGLCKWNVKSRFGIHSERIHGDFYLTAAAKPPGN